MCKIKQLEDELTVDEAIGVCKYLILTTPIDLDEYMFILEEYAELGLGETTVSDCREVVKFNGDS